MYSLLSPLPSILPFPSLFCARHPAISIFLSLYSRAEHDDRRFSILFSLPRPLSPPPLLPLNSRADTLHVLFTARYTSFGTITFRFARRKRTPRFSMCVACPRARSESCARARFSNFTIEDNSVARYYSSRTRMLFRGVAHGFFSPLYVLMQKNP